jgi:hypothetical protein
MARHSCRGASASFVKSTTGSAAQKRGHVAKHRRFEQSASVRTFLSLLGVSITTLLVVLTLGATADAASSR